MATIATDVSVSRAQAGRIRRAAEKIADAETIPAVARAELDDLVAPVRALAATQPDTPLGELAEHPQLDGLGIVLLCRLLELGYSDDRGRACLLLTESLACVPGPWKGKSTSAIRGEHLDALAVWHAHHPDLTFSDIAHPDHWASTLQRPTEYVEMLRAGRLMDGLGVALPVQQDGVDVRLLRREDLAELEPLLPISLAHHLDWARRWDRDRHAVLLVRDCAGAFVRLHHACPRHGYMGTDDLYCRQHPTVAVMWRR